METESKNFLTETAKIRHYVMNLILRNGNQSVKIQSSRSLAEKFSVARGTVRAAVEKMVHENYLITRRGIGTFTNPSKALCASRQVPPKLIGIKIMSGDMFFLDPPAMRTLSVLLDEFSKKNFIVRFLTGNPVTPEDCKYELDHCYADGIVGYSCTPGILEEAIGRIPVVGVNCGGKHVPAIQYSYHDAVEELKQLLNGSGLILCAELSLPPQLKTELGNSGLRLLRKEFSELEAIPGLPGGIFLPEEYLAEFHALLQKRGLSAQDSKPFLLTQSEKPLPYWRFESPRRAACRKAADMLEAMFRGEQPDGCTMEFHLKPINQTSIKEDPV